MPQSSQKGYEMNYNMLTNEEILRIADPKTDLEKRLLTLVDEKYSEDSQRVEEAECNFETLKAEYDDLDSHNDDLTDGLNDLNDLIDKLKKRMDDKDIDYSDLI